MSGKIFEIEIPDNGNEEKIINAMLAIARVMGNTDIVERRRVFLLTEDERLAEILRAVARKAAAMDVPEREEKPKAPEKKALEARSEKTCEICGEPVAGRRSTICGKEYCRCKCRCSWCGALKWSMERGEWKHHVCAKR